MAAEAFHGPAGDFVRAVEPHTEADPAALLVQFLAAFGNVIGRAAHFSTDGVQHFMNLYTVLVGRSAKSRKGTSWARVRQAFSQIDFEWLKDRLQKGLSSGEGLIWAVRDAGTIPRPGGGSQKDPGVTDKRLLVQEPEFASVLSVCQRQGNTLSPVVREAWDGGVLQILTKNSPAKATGSHISIVGHITSAELLRCLTNTEQANGFANRFLWVCVARSKMLPDGGALCEGDLVDVCIGLDEAVAFAAAVGEMKRDEEARGLWHEVYARLSADRYGLFGAITARAEAQTMRLTCLYALLDQSSVLRIEHLKAALAVWRYCQDSVRFIFGDALGDPSADAILRALRAAPDGMTKTAINDVFGRNQSSREIDRALGVLLEHGLARREKLTTAGRPTEKWLATEAGAR